MEELVAVAKIVKPRGLRGEVVADLLTDFPDRFEGLENVTGIAPDGKRADLKIQEFWFQKDRIVFRFEGFDSVDEADKLRDFEICVPESAAAELEEGAFFDWQLIGCDVKTIEGTSIGKVRDVMRTGGTEILVVESGSKEYLIPFAESICPEVDIENKIVRVDPPDGLLEF